MAIESTLPLRMSSVTIRDKRVLTAYVASQVLYHVTQVVYESDIADHVTVEHEVTCNKNTDVLGYYLVRVLYSNNGNDIQLSHTFDLQLLLDMRANWMTLVTTRIELMLYTMKKEAANE